MTHVAPSASVTYTLTPRLSSYGDVYDDVPKQGPSTPIADGGFTFLLSNNVQLDAEVGCWLEPCRADAVLCGRPERAVLSRKAGQ